MLGFCFASWASRIPYIQQRLSLTEGQFGFILLALPAGSFVSLPFAGFMVAKYGSKKVLCIVSTLYGLTLIAIGLSANHIQLILSLFCFGLIGNAGNISVNTQAVGVELLYKKQIMATFHGMWSLAGFAGAAAGILMNSLHLVPYQHFTIVCIISFIIIAVAHRYLLPDVMTSNEKTPLFALPDKSLVVLGLIAFCCMLCEGTMFDWSGIYFKKVVNPSPALVGAGYTAFMSTMAASRFVSDHFTNRYGFKIIVKISGLTIMTGLLIAVVFPYFYPVLIGFLLVGAGVSSIVPMVYSAAGKSTKMSPGKALASVSTISFLGFLIGPPIIGMIAGFSGLRFSFALIAIVGLCITLLARLSRDRY